MRRKGRRASARVRSKAIFIASSLCWFAVFTPRAGCGALENPTYSTIRGNASDKVNSRAGFTIGHTVVINVWMKRFKHVTTAIDTIEICGGTRAVAERFGEEYRTVWNWRVRGLPPDSYLGFPQALARGARDRAARAVEHASGAAAWLVTRGARSSCSRS